MPILTTCLKYAVIINRVTGHIMVNDEILIYSPGRREGRQRLQYLMGTKLAGDEAKAFSFLMRMNGRLH